MRSIDAARVAIIADLNRIVVILSSHDQARESLSSASEAKVHLPKGSFPSAPDVEFSTTVSRGELEQAVAPLIERYVPCNARINAPTCS